MSPLLKWRWSFVVSAMFHAAIISALLYVSFAPPDSPESRRRAPIQLLPPYAGQLMSDQQKVAVAMTPAQKRQVIEQRLDELNQIDAGELRKITRLIEEQHGLNDRPGGSGKPSADRSEGEFDFDTATILDIKRLTAGGKPLVIEWTFVDGRGRRLQYERPESDLDDSERNLLRVFELAKQNPNLRMLLESASRIAGAIHSQHSTTQKGR